MNVALIFAGGVGQRMKISSKPKQFLELYGKPILIYTLEKFEDNPEIDSIVLICVKEWIEHAKLLLKRYGISKVCAVVSGGETGQISIRNGVEKAHELFPSDTILLIHDGVRPLIDSKTISKAIRCVKKNGNAITISPCIETVVTVDDKNDVDRVINRNRCFNAKAPQCFILKDIYGAHMKAKDDGYSDFIDSACLMAHYGHQLHCIEGSSSNIKITTPMDYYLFKAIIDANEMNDMFSR